jgi:ABC-type enterochelin transport system substrate-binding protein
MTTNWYGIKSILRFDTMPGPPKEGTISAVEERVVVLTASSFDEALSKGEVEAREYAASARWPNDAGQEVACRYLDAIEVYQISGELVSGAEVFSKTIFVSRDEADSRLIDRLMGSEDEAGKDVHGAFEPDFERIADAAPQKR